MFRSPLEQIEQIGIPPDPNVIGGGYRGIFLPALLEEITFPQDPKSIVFGRKKPSFKIMSDRLAKKIIKEQTDRALKKKKFKRVDKPLSQKEKAKAKERIAKDQRKRAKEAKSRKKRKAADAFFDQDEPYTTEELNRFNRGPPQFGLVRSITSEPLN